MIVTYRAKMAIRAPDRANKKKIGKGIKRVKALIIQCGPGEKRGKQRK